MHVHGVFPYLFVRYYASAEPLSSYMEQFAAGLDRAINIALGSAASTRQHVYKISLVSGMSVFMHHNAVCIVTLTVTVYHH